MDALEIIGRVLFSLIFLASGIGHFKSADAMAGYAKSKGIPAAKLSVLGSGVLILVGAVLVILGNNIGGLLLVIFLVPTAFLMHPFWKETDPMAKMAEQAGFLKDLALAGAALILFLI